LPRQLRYLAKSPGSRAGDKFPESTYQEPEANPAIPASPLKPEAETTKKLSRDKSNVAGETAVSTFTPI
jgi:hypothetical protein